MGQTEMDKLFGVIYSKAIFFEILLAAGIGASFIQTMNDLRDVFAGLSGATIVAFRLSKDTKLRDVLIYALGGFAFANFLAPWLCNYKRWDAPAEITGTHFLLGVIGQLVLAGILNFFNTLASETGSWAKAFAGLVRFKISSSTKTEPDGTVTTTEKTEIKTTPKDGVSN